MNKDMYFAKKVNEIDLDNKKIQRKMDKKNNKLLKYKNKKRIDKKTYLKKY